MLKMGMPPQADIRKRKQIKKRLTVHKVPFVFWGLFHLRKYMEVFHAKPESLFKLSIEHIAMVNWTNN